jgi:hypothetical protein
MKYRLWILLTILTACGGTLSDEQRKKLKEGIKKNAIIKVTEAEITDAAFTMGRSLARRMEKTTPANRKLVDSLQRTFNVTIFALHPGDSLLLEIEKQIVEAYTSASGQAQLSDNIQRIGKDSVLYTKPIMVTLPDGSLQFNYALGIRIPKKQVVLSIQQ